MTFKFEETFNSIKLKNGLKLMIKRSMNFGNHPILVMNQLLISLIHSVLTQLDIVKKKKAIILLILSLFLKTIILEMVSYLVFPSILFIKNMTINAHVVMDLCFQKINLNVYLATKFMNNALNANIRQELKFVLNVELV